MKLGIDLFQTRQKIALLSSASTCTSEGEPSFWKLFHNAPLRKLFSAEHGFALRAAAGDAVSDDREPRTGLPIYSLYQAHTKALNTALLEDVDALCYDLQDVGARFYTYTSSLLECLRACKKAGKLLIVLDRPNPVGNALEGFGMSAGFTSFVGAFSAPMRYGLTCGELARYLNQGIGADLEVVPMQGYDSRFYWKDTGLPWTKPSPNIIDADACQVYLATCLMEGLNVSEGRGTVKPFYQIGAPFIRSEDWIRRIGRVDGVELLPVCFVPQASKYRGELCHGVELVLQKKWEHTFELALRLVTSLQALYPQNLEYVQGEQGYFLDLLCGNDRLRHGLSVERGLEIAAADCRAFFDIQKEVSLYGK